MQFKAAIYPKIWFVFAAWVAIILGVGRLQTGGEEVGIIEALSSGPRYSVLVAMIFGLGCVAFWKVWKETGWTAIPKGASWWLLIVPLAFIVAFSAFGMSQSNIAESALLIILMNSLIVGVNEEVMLRGLVFSGMADRFSFGAACIITTVLFGAMHLLNYFNTGELHILQAITTMATGLMLLAIRVGMGSIIPAVILHGLWDFGTAMTATVTDYSGGTLVQLVPLGIIVAPILFAIIGGIYLWRYNKRLKEQDVG